MRTRWLGSGFVALAVLAGPAAAQCPASTPVQGGPPGVQVFPADNWWNLDITNAPVDPNSAAYINWIGPTKGLHPDLGGVWDPENDGTYGMPYVVIDADDETKQAVEFEVWDESDGTDLETGEALPFYPIPVEAIDTPFWVEGGPAATEDIRGDNDRHLILVDCKNRHLYELYNVWYDEAQSQWYAYSGAFFDLDTNDRRPETWTSADAAGLAIFPGLVRWDEASDPEREDLGHAIRMTTRDTNGYVWPASHDAGNGVGAPPLGTRLRLKALDSNGLDPVLRTNNVIARRILRTMQKYGMIIADNGSDMYFTGTFDPNWEDANLNSAVGLIKASDFEVIELGWDPTQVPDLSIADVKVAESNSGTRNIVFTVSLSQASLGPVTFDIATANGTAKSGTDYTAKSLTGQVIAAGATSKTFTVQFTGDTAVEPNETLYANVTNVDGANVVDAQGRATILNDDGPYMYVTDVATPEGNSGTKQITFTVRLSQAAAVPVTYNAATSNATASAGSDYVAKSLAGETIPAGQTSRPFTVTINGDTSKEGNEVIRLTLGNVSGATLYDDIAGGSITNDDGPNLRVSNASVSEGNSGTKTMTFTVSTPVAHTAPITYTIATGDTTALAGSDYVAKTLTGQTINAGVLSRTFTVTVNGDTAVEANETMKATISSPTGATIYDAVGVGTITNDD